MSVSPLFEITIISSIAISPDGQTLVSGGGGYDKTIKVWNLDTGELSRTFAEHSRSVNSVAISPDGQTLVSGSDDNTIKVWSLHTGELLRTIEGHSHEVKSVAISSDGQTLVSSAREIVVWGVR